MIKRSSCWLLAPLALAFATCTSLEDAPPAERNTFVRFYEAGVNLTAADIEETEDGYVILANTERNVLGVPDFRAVLFEVNRQGNRTSDFTFIPNLQAKTLKKTPAAGGYLVAGDSIRTDPFASQAANVRISSLRLLEINSDFQIVRQFRRFDPPAADPNAIRRDYEASAVNFDNNGRIILLGTEKDPVPNQSTAPAKQMLMVLNADLTINWEFIYNLEALTYQNARSVHLTPANRIIWATAIADVQGQFNTSWLAIPFAENQSIFENFSQFGQISPRRLIPADIQPARDPGLGYGVVGTYSESTDGTKGNIFFLKVLPNGTIDVTSDRYFDAIDSRASGTSLDNRDNSSSINEGKSICATRDGGFVLAGTVQTVPGQLGNGGLDVYLIKVDAFGNVQWQRTLGGAFDENVVTVRETSDGRLIVLGTVDSDRYQYIFLMKTTANGEILN